MTNLKDFVVVKKEGANTPVMWTRQEWETYLANPNENKWRFTLITTFNASDELKDEPLKESAGVEEMFRKRFGDTPDMSDVAHWCVYEQGFIDGGAASPAGDGWVSVQVDLPKTDDEVLVYFDCDEMIVQAYFNHRNNIWYGSANVRSQMREGDCEDAELRHEKVTHWRPLPTPPNKSV